MSFNPTKKNFIVHRNFPNLNPAFEVKKATGAFFFSFLIFSWEDLNIVPRDIGKRHPVKRLLVKEHFDSATSDDVSTKLISIISIMTEHCLPSNVDGLYILQLSKFLFLLTTVGWLLIMGYFNKYLKKHLGRARAH